MKMGFIRTLCIFGILSALLLSASCGGKPEKTSSKGSSNPTQSADSGEESAETSDSSDPGESAGTDGGQSGGGASKSQSQQKTGGKLLDTPVTFTVTTYEHPNQPYKKDALKFKEITAKTNVTLKLNVVPAASYAAKITTMLSSATLSDLNQILPATFRQYPTSLYYDLTNRIQKDVPNYYKWIKDDIEVKKLNIDGKTYSFVQMFADAYPLKSSGKEKDIWGVVPVIRYDILDKNNLPVPKTWDQWFTVMKRLKAIYPDSTPYAGRGGGGILRYMTHALGAQYNLNYDYDKGRYIYGVLEPEFKSILKFMADAYAEGIIDPNLDKENVNTWNQGVQANKIFFWLDNNSFSDMQTAALQKTNPSAKMATMPLMANSSGKKRAIGFEGAGAYSDYQWVISAKTKYADQILKFMDWCYSDEGLYVNNFGKEGESYTKQPNGGVKLADSLVKKYKGSATPDFMWKSDLGLGQLSFTPLVSGLASMSEALGVYKNTTWAPLKDDLAAGAIKPVFVDPTLPANIRENITKKAAAVDALFYSNLIKFVKGETSLDAFDQFVSQIKGLGAQEVLNAYNDAVRNLK